MIRIGVSGSHSVGKTTFIEALASFLRKQGKTVVIAEEPIKIIQKNIKLTGKNTSQLQLYQLLMAEHFKRLAKIQGVDYILYDRTLLDFVAYLSLEAKLDPSFLHMVEQILPYYQSFFDYSFLLGIEFPIQQSSHRPASEQHRKHIEERILLYLNNFKIEYFQLFGGVNHRVDKAWCLLRQ